MTSFLLNILYRNIIFFSSHDEEAFLEWLQKIKGVKVVKEDKQNLSISTESLELSYESLDNLIAIFYRYDLENKSQLRVFLNDNNKEWFLDSETFWFDDIFGNQKDK